MVKTTPHSRAKNDGGDGSLTSLGLLRKVLGSEQLDKDWQLVRGVPDVVGFAGGELQVRSNSVNSARLTTW